MIILNYNEKKNQFGHKLVKLVTPFICFLQLRKRLKNWQNLFLPSYIEKANFTSFPIRNLL
jgi:hypothetical protein